MRSQPPGWLRQDSAFSHLGSSSATLAGYRAAAYFAACGGSVRFEGPLWPDAALNNGFSCELAIQTAPTRATSPHARNSDGSTTWM